MATVRIVGVEPTRPKALEPKSSASAKFRQMRFTPTRPERRADNVIDSLSPLREAGRLAELRSNSTSRSYRARTDDLLGVNQTL